MINETRGPPFSDCVPMSDAESSVHLHIFVFVFNALKTIVILILILLFHKCNWLNTHDHWSLTSGRRVKLTHLWSLCCCVIIVTDHLPVVWISCFLNVVNWATQSWCWLYFLRQNFVNTVRLTVISRLSHEKDASHIYMSALTSSSVSFFDPSQVEFLSDP